MHRGIYKIAGFSVEIQSFYEDVHILCEEYKSDENPDFCVTVTKERIEYEKKKPGCDGAFTDGYCETLAVYRILCENLLDFDILLLHGSALTMDGRGYIFCADSGTGKSTHAALWRKRYGDRVKMINDDKPLLKIEDRGVTAYGTPWCGKENRGNNISSPLNSVCFLQRGHRNEITEISKAQGFKNLIRSTYIPRSTEKAQKVMSLLEKAVVNLEFYSMKCNTQITAAERAYEKMR